MTRKTTITRKQAEEALERFKQSNALLEEAEKEEGAIVERTQKAVEEICTKENLFCGVILSKEDIIGIIQLAFKTNEPVKIPFALYFNE